MKFGEFEINAFVEQEFRLDGGLMFGVVPRTMWEKLIPADENNLIPMKTNIFVLKAHGKVFIFDSGLGDTLSDQERKIYSANGVSRMEPGLASLGLSVDDIDYVILTHLHTDHSGGAVTLVGGEFAPRFSKATVIASRGEWQVATNPDERTRAVYKPERLMALKDAGKVELVDTNTELFKGIRAVHTGGHTQGHFALEMQSGDRKVFYYADIFCSSAHMPVPYVPATDLFPLETMDVKRGKLPEIVGDKVVMAFDHDIHIPMGVVRQDGRRFVVDPVERATKEIAEET